MLTDLSPMDNVTVRKALKHAVRREELVEKILMGHGAVANDHPIGPANQYYHAELEQNAYDPDRSKALLKEAGLDGLSIDLSVSEAAFSGAIDAGLLYQASARDCGIDINVVQEPADGYWSNVWIKKPWCASYWSGRVTEDWMFTLGYEAGAAWNDTHWEDQRFQTLLREARAELDSDKRREMYHEMQALCSSEGATAIPMYANFVDGYNTKLGHPEVVGNVFDLDSNRICERWWMA